MTGSRFFPFLSWNQRKIYECSCFRSDVTPAPFSPLLFSTLSLLQDLLHMVLLSADVQICSSIFKKDEFETAESCEKHRETAVLVQPSKTEPERA